MHMPQQSSILETLITRHKCCISLRCTAAMVHHLCLTHSIHFLLPTPSPNTSPASLGSLRPNTFVTLTVSPGALLYTRTKWHCKHLHVSIHSPSFRPSDCITLVSGTPLHAGANSSIPSLTHTISQHLSHITGATLPQHICHTHYWSRCTPFNVHQVALQPFASFTPQPIISTR